LAGIFGAIIGLIGFYLTISQVREAKTAADAARDAANQVKSKILLLDIVSELSVAGGALREAQRHLKLPAWNNAIESYLNARECLVRVSSVSQNLKPEEKDKMSKTLADISSFCNYIERNLNEGKMIDVPKALYSCRDHVDFITELSVNLRDRES
jgi:hypothetical protein